MKRPLEQLLKVADESAGGPPALPPDLAGRVLQRAKRGSRRRAAAGTLAVLLAIGGAALLAPHLRSRPGADVVVNPTPPAVGDGGTVSASADALRAELARLNAEADSASAVAVRMADILRHGERMDVLRREAAQPGIEVEIARRMEEAALAAIRGAEREYKLLNRPAEAALDYERIMRTYPDTVPAEIARRRLVEIRGGKGSSRNLGKEYGNEAAYLHDRSVGSVGGDGGKRLRTV